MGSGISLLLAEQIAFAAPLENKAGTYVLSLIDISDEGLLGLLAHPRAGAQDGGEADQPPAAAERADLVEKRARWA